MLRTLRLSLLPLTALSASLFAMAQSPPVNLRGRLDPERETDRPALPEERVDLPSGSASIPGGLLSGAPIQTIDFEGVAVPGNVAQAAQPFIGQTMSRETLKALVDAMSDAYRESDVALFTIVVPEQDFSAGRVRVLVAEGHINTIEISGDIDPDERVFIRGRTQPLTRGRPTSRRDLNRSLLLLNDVPGLKVSQTIVKSPEQGAVDLRLDAKQKRYDFSLGYDSRTTGLIDQGRLSGEAAGYGLLRTGDETRLDVASSTDFDSFRYIGLQHATPLGRNGLRASAGIARIESFADDSGLSGEADLYSGSLSYPFIRSARQNLRGALVVDALNSNNAAFGSLLATERTRAVRTTLSYDRTRPNRYVGGNLKLSQGLDVWDAEISRPVGELEFFKAQASLSFVQRFARQYFLRANMSAQWTDDPLPANERFSVGGPNFGRAFETGLLNADKGASVLLEAAYRPWKEGKFARSEIYTFADYADVSFIDRPIGSLDLGSAGIGIRAAYKDMAELGLEAARPYDVPVPGYQDDWQFAVSWRLKFDPR